MVSPPACLTPNAAMDESGLLAAAAIVNKLLDLGVIRSLEEGITIVTNAPSLLSKKEGQP